MLRMKSARAQLAGLGLLVVLLAVQVGMLASRSRASVPRSQYVPLELGARLSSVRFESPVGPLTADDAAIDERYTVLLAFKSTCRYCERAVPAWRQLDLVSDSLQRAGVRVRKISSESLPVANRWLADHALLAQNSVRIADAVPGSIGHSLTGRTPWYFVFDSAGTLIAQGYGGEALAAVARLPAVD